MADNREIGRRLLGPEMGQFDLLHQYVHRLDRMVSQIERHVERLEDGRNLAVRRMLYLRAKLEEWRGRDLMLKKGEQAQLDAGLAECVADLDPVFNAARAFRERHAQQDEDGSIRERWAKAFRERHAQQDEDDSIEEGVKLVVGLLDKHRNTGWIPPDPLINFLNRGGKVWCDRCQRWRKIGVEAEAYSISVGHCWNDECAKEVHHNG